MNLIVAIALGLQLAATSPTTAQAVPGSGAGAPAADSPGLEWIRRAELMKTVEYLASPEADGRAAGSPGYMKVAAWMADRFRQLGLKPVGDEGYFQNLEVEYNEIEACRLAILGPDGAPRELQLGPDYLARGFTGSGDVTAPVVFLGYGLSLPGRGYDDYAGIDARGKVVLAFKEPPPFHPDSLGWGDVTLPRPKGLVAAAHGAVALLIVPVPGQSRSTKPIASMLEGDGEEDGRFPRLQVDPGVAEELLRGSGFTLRGLQALIDSTRAPHPLSLAPRVRVQVEARYHPKQRSVNVVGMFEGSDPKLAQECVVIGAHLDHVGSQAHEIYFPGANDNASGSAGVLAVAEAFARAKVRPKRSILFALFSSEEAGLHGARRFLAAPPVPADRIAAYLNLDCVGHGDSIQVGGGKTWPAPWWLARDLDRQDSGLTVSETWPGGGADAAPFEQEGIPNLYFASKFSYTHLHMASDTPATLNPPLLEAVARLVYRTAWRIAQGGDWRE